MIKRFLIGAVAVAMIGTALTVSSGTAEASNIGDEGCTPGYYKNHTDNWWEDADNTIPSYDPSDIFGTVFGVDHDVTLIKALQGGGGKGIAGAHKILARAATAAILTAAHEGLGYPLRRNSATAAGPGIFAAVQDVWDSGDRQAILDLATMFDGYNNLGCPLN